VNTHRVLSITLVWLACCSCTTAPRGPVTDPSRVVLPYEWVGNIDKGGFNEPSGILFDPGRGTLFVVGDEGQICEITTEGEMLRNATLIEGADFEGLARAPETGTLYVAVEGEEAILEVDPETFALLRRFDLPREAGGVELFRPGGNGIEAICFVPDARHPEGGTFFVANQSFSLEPDEELSVIVEVELPLREAGQTAPVRLLRWFEPGVIDISALHHDAETGHILAASDAANCLLELTIDGRCLQVLALTGDNQEGMTLDAEGFMYIAQDSGGVIKIRPLWPFPRR